jgi:hypothetical protein
MPNGVVVYEVVVDILKRIVEFVVWVIELIS